MKNVHTGHISGCQRERRCVVYVGANINVEDALNFLGLFTAVPLHVTIGLREKKKHRNKAGVSCIYSIQNQGPVCLKSRVVVCHSTAQCLEINVFFIVSCLSVVFFSLSTFLFHHPFLPTLSSLGFKFPQVNQLLNEGQIRICFIHVECLGGRRIHSP